MKTEKYSIDKYTCERCEYQWMQRPDAKRDKTGLKITEVLLATPKTCSNCKSPYWYKPRQNNA